MMNDNQLDSQVSFSYGPGRYLRDGREFTGQIILDAHKLFLKGGQGELSLTFIPLEKIYKVRFFWNRLKVFVRPSSFTQFTAVITGERREMQGLVRDLAQRRGFRRKKFGLEWVDPDV